MMNTLYWDCFSGIAGNMAVASLLDLGADRDKLINGLNSMHFPEGPVRPIIEERLVNGIRGLYFNTPDDHSDEHDHHPDSEEYAQHAHCSGEVHDHLIKHGDHDQCHDHDHSHGQHSHCHNGSRHHQTEAHHHHAPHRGFSEICAMIDHADISENAKKTAKNCFKVLAEAEAAIHGKSIEEVHFHEVGARDSIADIVGAAICLDDLNITEVRVSPVHLGSGFVKCSHGIMPVPAPATALLLKGYSVVFDHEVNCELTTPTGAAILKGVNAKNSDGPQIFTRVGHGHGSKDTGRANFLRAFLTESEMQKKKTPRQRY